MKHSSTFVDLLNADLKEHSARFHKHCPAKSDKFSHVKIQRYRRDHVLRAILVNEMASVRMKLVDALQKQEVAQ